MLDIEYMINHHFSTRRFPSYDGVVPQDFVVKLQCLSQLIGWVFVDYFESLITPPWVKKVIPLEIQLEQCLKELKAKNLSKYFDKGMDRQVYRRSVHGCLPYPNLRFYSFVAKIAYLLLLQASHDRQSYDIWRSGFGYNMQCYDLPQDIIGPFHELVWWKQALPIKQSTLPSDFTSKFTPICELKIYAK
jgi:hypothetical protein